VSQEPGPSTATIIPPRAELPKPVSQEPGPSTVTIIAPNAELPTPGNQKPGTSNARRGQNLKGRKAKPKAKAKTTTKKDRVSWSAWNEITGQTWEFPAKIAFAKFWGDIGAITEDIWWYKGFGMDKEAALSTSSEFDTLLQVALSGEQSYGPIRIWKSSEDDFKSG
jgi:hypothetical protein